jgi:hypothetical protein
LNTRDTSVFNSGTLNVYTNNIKNFSFLFDHQTLFTFRLASRPVLFSKPGPTRDYYLWSYLPTHRITAARSISASASASAAASSALRSGVQDRYFALVVGGTGEMIGSGFLVVFFKGRASSGELIGDTGDTGEAALSVSRAWRSAVCRAETFLFFAVRASSFDSDFFVADPTSRDSADEAADDASDAAAASRAAAVGSKASSTSRAAARALRSAFSSPSLTRVFVAAVCAAASFFRELSSAPLRTDVTLLVTGEPSLMPEAVAVAAAASKKAEENSDDVSSSSCFRNDRRISLNEA